VAAVREALADEVPRASPTPDTSDGAGGVPSH
jgi:hypothetical protein